MLNRYPMSRKMLLCETEWSIYCKTSIIFLVQLLVKYYLNSCYLVLVYPCVVCLC